MTGFIIFVTALAIFAAYFLFKKNFVAIALLEKIKETPLYQRFIKIVKPNPDPEPDPSPVPKPEPQKTYCADVLILDVFDVKKNDTGKAVLVPVYKKEIALNPNEMACICREGDRSEEDNNIQLICLPENVTPQWKTVSERHLYISNTKDGFLMQDAYSSNGTFIYHNGEPNILVEKNTAVCISNEMIVYLGKQIVGFRIPAKEGPAEFVYPKNPDELDNFQGVAKSLSYPAIDAGETNDSADKNDMSFREYR